MTNGIVVHHKTSIYIKTAELPSKDVTLFIDGYEVPFRVIDIVVQLFTKHQAKEKLTPEMAGKFVDKVYAAFR